MTTAAFDTLGYFEKLKTAGVPEAQAKVQVEVIQDVMKSYNASSRTDLATKSDLQDVRNEIQNVKHEILKWFIGVTIGQAAFILAVMTVLLGRP